MEIQQSPFYKHYVLSLGWHVETLDDVQIFYKTIPFIGTLVKIQRPKILPYIPKLVPFLKKIRATVVAVEPLETVHQDEYLAWTRSLSKFVKIHKTPFLQTKTIRINLIPSEDIIFNRFSEAKRRAVRRAEKNGVIVKESNHIGDLIHIKNISAGLFGSITTYGIESLWKLLPPRFATTLISYHNSTMVGGILLIFYDSRAYYWIAGATHTGKKKFAPTLLVWEALKLAKKNHMKEFDFVGVWDERMPKENLSWAGFTKFKEGFGGYEIYYPITSMLRK